MTTKKKIISIIFVIVLALVVVASVSLYDKYYHSMHNVVQQQAINTTTEVHKIKLYNQSGDVLYEFSTLEENTGAQISISGDSATVIVPDAYCSCFDTDSED